MNKVLLSSGLVALSVLAAACSSSSKTSSTSTAATASSATSAPPSSASSSPSGGAAPSDAQLTPLMLQAGDLPTGWTSTPHQADPSDAANQAALVQCVGGKNTDTDKVAEANSPDFGLNGAQISSSATSYKTQADIDADVALLQNPKVSACYQQLLKAEIANGLPAGITVSSVSFTITPGSSGGASNVVGVGTGTVTLTQSGKSIPVYVANAFITGRLTEAEVDFDNPAQPIPVADFTTLVNTVAARAAKL